MVVYNKTSITSEEAKRVLIKSSKIEYSKKYVFSIVLILIGIPVMIYGFYQNNTIYWVFGSIFIAFAIVLIAFNTYQMFKIPKVVYEKNAEVCEHGVAYDYRFKEHSVYLIAKSNDRTTKFEYNYNHLRKIYEYNDRYELKFQDNVSLYVSKSGFENEKMEEFFRKNVTTSKKKIKVKK